MLDTVLAEIQKVCLSAAGAAITALVVYMFAWLRTYLGIKESDSNEAEIRNAALTEAGKLITTGKINDSDALHEAVTKVIKDLNPVVKAEGYDSIDVKDMILGAAATFFPPAGLLKNLIK
jgi:hypothetical protein